MGRVCHFLELGECSGRLDSDGKEVSPWPGSDHAHGAEGTVVHGLGNIFALNTEVTAGTWTLSSRWGCVCPRFSRL